MKALARYYFNSKTEMNAWIEATADMHQDQAKIEDDLDFYLVISSDSKDLFYSEFNSYFPDVDGKEWPEDQKYQVIV